MKLPIVSRSPGGRRWKRRWQLLRGLRGSYPADDRSSCAPAGPAGTFRSGGALACFDSPEGDSCRRHRNQPRVHRRSCSAGVHDDVASGRPRTGAGLRLDRPSRRPAPGQGGGPRPRERPQLHLRRTRSSGRRDGRLLRVARYRAGGSGCRAGPQRGRVLRHPVRMCPDRCDLRAVELAADRHRARVHPQRQLAGAVGARRLVRRVGRGAATALLDR